MQGIEDEAVVGRARAGDLVAFQCLVEQYSRDVFRLAFRITGNEQDAEDAVQETFLRVHQNLADFDGRASFGTWLYRVAANTSIDVLRRRRRESSRSAPLEDLVENGSGPLSADPDPERLLLGREIGDRLRSAFGQMSDLERTAFVLRHFEGLPLNEISRALGARLGATKQAVFRAVRKVRKTLEPVMRTTS